MAAHQYWRLYITEGNSATGVDIATLQMRATSGGADQCSGGTASASNAAGANPAVNAFDGSNTTTWQTTALPTLPVWLKYAFAAPVTVTQIAMVFSSAGYSFAPKAFDVQFSDDNSSWTTAWSASGLSSPTFSTTYTSTEPPIPARVSAQSLEVLSASAASGRITAQSLEVLTNTWQQRLIKSYALAVVGPSPTAVAVQKTYALAVLDDLSLSAISVSALRAYAVTGSATRIGVSNVSVYAVPGSGVGIGVSNLAAYAVYDPGYVAVSTRRRVFVGTIG